MLVDKLSSNRVRCESVSVGTLLIQGIESTGLPALPRLRCGGSNKPAVLKGYMPTMLARTVREA